MRARLRDARAAADSGETSDNSMSDSSPHNSRPQLLSVVLPCYNEQEVLPLTFARFAGMATRLGEWNLDYELIFVNDGSADATPQVLDDMAGRDRHVRVVHLARNFGHQAA